MLLELENIGKIKKSGIELQGITVLAGLNGSGKSTFGKALFSVFSAFFEPEKGIEQEKESLIKEDIRSFITTGPYMITERKVANDILRSDRTLPEIRNVISNAVEKGLIAASRMGEDSKDVLSRKIADDLGKDSKQLLQFRVEKFFEAEFEEQTVDIGKRDSQGSVCLKINGGRIEVKIIGRKCVDCSDSIGIINRVFYIDTPFILDETNNRYVHYSKISHRGHLWHNLNRITNRRNIDEEKTVEIGFLMQRFENVFSTVNPVLGEFKRTSSGLRFQESGLNEPLALLNVSTGMKPFLIIKRLFETGKIKDKDILILDAPEIHLHPEWQLKFAEALVLYPFRLGIRRNGQMEVFCQDRAQFFRIPLSAAEETFARRYKLRKSFIILIVQYFLLEKLP